MLWMTTVRKSIHLGTVVGFVLIFVGFPLSIPAEPGETSTQSERILPLEMTRERAVFEFTMGREQDRRGSPEEERALVALPPGREYPVEVLEAEYTESPAPSDAPGIIVWRAGDSTEKTSPDKAEKIVQIKPLGICRDLALARITVRFEVSDRNGKERVTRKYRRLRFAIRFSPLEVAPSSRTPDPGFQSMLSKILLNPDVPAEWRIVREALPVPEHEDIPEGTRGPYWKVLAEGEGFFALPTDRLPKGVEPGRFDLVDRRKSVSRLKMDRESLGMDAVVF
jgi:hypothetical protein